MALPSAQLGSMPSMSPMSAVPAQVIEKRVPLWQQLLSQIALQTAGAAATQGVGNLMERDYADEFGKTKAQGWDRLRGPTVGAREAEQLRKIEADKAAQNKDILSRRALEQMRAANDLKLAAGNLDARATTEGMEYDRTLAKMDQTERLAREEMAMKDKQLAQEVRAKNLMEQIREAREGPARTVQMGRDAATTAKTMAEAEGQNLLNQGNAKVVADMIQRGATTGGQPSAGLKNFAAGQAGGVGQVAPVAPPAAVTPTPEQTVQSLLASGKSADEVLALLQEQQAQEAITSQGAEFDRILRAQKAAGRDVKLEQILKALGTTGPIERASPAPYGM